MEHTPNTNSNMTNDKIILQNIVEHLMSGNICSKNDSNTKYLSFNDFRNLLLKESGHSISFREKVIEYNDYKSCLYLFSTVWQRKSILPKSNEFEQNYLYKYFNSLIIEVKYNKNSDEDFAYKVIMYGGPKVYDSNRDDFSLEKVEQNLGIDIASQYSSDGSDDLDSSDTRQSIQNKSESTIVDTTVTKFQVYDAFEGTTINAFFYNGVWYFCTKRKFDMFESKFGNQKTHGEMVEEIVGNMEDFCKSLDENFTYHFVLVHSENVHLTEITPEENKLVLTSVRYNFKHDQEKYDQIDTTYFKKPTKPTNASIKAFKTQTQPETDTNKKTQGIIVQYNDFVFRIYSKTYADSLKQTPHFNSNHVKCFFDYQNNALNNNDEKTWTISAFDFVAICLFRTLTHVTKFADKFSEEEKIENASLRFPRKFIKINKDDWDDYIYDKESNNNALIRNILELQYLPFKIPKITTVNFNQVKHHLKYHCTPQEIYAMFHTFYKDVNKDNYDQPTEPTLCHKIGYKRLTNFMHNIKSFEDQNNIVKK
jgi:hypothetical protein